MYKILIIILLLSITACTNGVDIQMEKEIQNEKIATFAGGCFWCIEGAFDVMEGIDAVSGYSGGKAETANYERVSSGRTQHYEAVRIRYDSKKYTYEQILKTFLIQIDPTDEDGQFADQGKQYQTAIFYHDEEQKNKAEKALKNIEPKFESPIVVKVIPYQNFFEAEEYHQDYAQKRTLAYKAYAKGSGREKYIEETWKDEKELLTSKTSLSQEEIKNLLTPLQYSVTQEGGTEKAFDNEYWDEKREGIYVDLINGEALFSSIDKYVSGTGWPSFTKPMNNSDVITKRDFKLIIPRTEVRSSTGHLGHVFNDGPKDAGGKRYCLNSAALKFVPKEDMEKEGYGEYLKLFET